jgi:hypothetical protein
MVEASKARNVGTERILEGKNITTMDMKEKTESGWANGKLQNPNRQLLQNRRKED